MHLIPMVMAMGLAGMRGSSGGEFVGLVSRCCGCDLLRVGGLALVASFGRVGDRRGAISPGLLAGVVASAFAVTPAPPFLPVLLRTLVFRFIRSLDFPFVAVRSSGPCGFRFVRVTVNGGVFRLAFPLVTAWSDDPSPTSRLFVFFPHGMQHCFNVTFRLIVDFSAGYSASGFCVRARLFPLLGGLISFGDLWKFLFALSAAVGLA